MTDRARRSSRAGRLLRRFLAAVVVAGIAGLAIWGFLAGRDEASKEAERERPVQAPPRVSAVDGQPVVQMDARTLAANGIAVATLPSAPYRQQIRGYGTVLDLARLTDLANSYANARAQQQMAQARLAASQTASDRARRLYRDQQNISLAQFQAADATALADQAALASAASQVRTLAATASQTYGPVVGAALLNNAPLVTRLMERQDFLLEVTLPPGIALHAPPRNATIEVQGVPSATARFLSPATRTDPRIQGVGLLYLAPASSGVLPGMNVLVSLPAGAPTDGVAIPPSALVWWQDRAWVYRQTGADTFVRTPIPTDLPSPDGGYVVTGLAGRAHIVTRGAQALLSEEFRAQLHVGAD